MLLLGKLEMQNVKPMIMDIASTTEIIAKMVIKLGFVEDQMSEDVV